jgi:hypothetical protein
MKVGVLMKKIVLLIMLMITSVFTLNLVTHANDVWTLNETDGYYYYDNYPSVFNGSLIEFNISVAENEILEVKDFTLGIYFEPKDTSGNPYKSLTVRYVPSGSTYDVYIIFSASHEMIMWSANPNYIDTFLSIRKLVDINDIPDDQYQTIDELPITSDTGNFLNDVGRVTFTVSNQEVILTLTYYQTYKVKLTMDPSVDMSLFDTFEAYYINVDNKPQIWINNARDNRSLSDIMLTDDQATFIPHSIWDLTTNAVKHINTYQTYTYLKQNDEGVMMAYFYIDEFIIDKLLTATLTYTSREYSTNLFGLIENYTEWQKHYWQYTSDDVLAYRNLTMDWEAYIPVYNLISLLIKLDTVYEMPRIDEVNTTDIQDAYNITLSEINNHFTAVKSDFNLIESDSRYKLFAFALEGGKDYDTIVSKVKTEVYHNYDDPSDPNNFKVIELIYQTDGIIYVTKSEDMDSIIAIETENTEPSDDLSDLIANFYNNTIKPLFSKYPELIIIVLIIGVVMYLSILSWVSKVYKKSKKGLKVLFSPLGLVMTGVIGFIILLLLSGVI